MTGSQWDQPLFMVAMVLLFVLTLILAALIRLGAFYG